MAPRRKGRQRDARIAFEAIAIEGGLLSPEWLARVAQLQAAGQSEADYRIPKGLNLRDEIGRYWRIAQAHWTELQAGIGAGADAQALAERFVCALLRESFGFESLAAAEPVEIGGRTFPIGHHALGGHVPVVIASAGSDLDTLAPAFGDGGRRRSAFGLAQEFVNASENAAWGLACDGVTLRLVRDNASLTRPAWIEADLGRVFAEERYADFAALWLLAHETRFGAPDRPATDCPLELWRAAGREEGTRARERLRDGVEETLLALGQGFLAHSENQPLRDALQSGSLTTTAYFQQLLRLVYRLIFLLTAEERGVLHAEGSPEPARRLYTEGYGLRRLRDRAVRRSAHDRFSDLWEGLKIVLGGVATGEPCLALPALGGLFDANQCPHLDKAKLENRALLSAVFRLSWLREDSVLSRVNWRDMGSEELGSVYESLLELVPQITAGGRTFVFAKGGETRGHARKLTGSYYTPDSLVKVLLDGALDPVVQATIAAHPEDPAENLLQLSVVDPACGSGHFLLAAARRLAAHVARLKADGTPSAAEYRAALRKVVSRCLFGVDLNPMAVELCRVSLWMEAVEPGRPLSFLDSHIQNGNSLLGTTPALMAKGVPDEAWDPIEGDDRKTASLLRKRSRSAAEGQRGFDTSWSKPAESESAEVARAVAELDREPDGTLTEVTGKETRWEQLLASPAYRHQRFVADVWCAAFVWPKPPVEQGMPAPLVEAAPTNDLWLQIRDGRGAPPLLTVKTAEELSRHYRFFHWHLAFPQVFSRGGFDVVLGNPPWEHVEVKEQEWFAERRPEIAEAQNAAARKRMIESLRDSDSGLFREFTAELRMVEGENHIARESGRFPLCARGRINSYALFAEHNRAILGPKGRAGFIVPSGIATDDNTRFFFQSLMEDGAIAALWEFENKGFFSAGRGHMLRFALLTLLGTASRVPVTDFLFQGHSVEDVRDPERHFSLTSEDVALLNPNTLTCPIFQRRRDATLNVGIYRRTGVLWHEADAGGNPWQISFLQGTFNMAADAALFRTRRDLQALTGTFDGNVYREVGGDTYVPLYEAKLVYLYNHRHGDFADAEPGERPHRLPEVPASRLKSPTYLVKPFYWVAQTEAESRLGSRWTRGWLIGWRNVTDARASVRTVVASILPRVGVGHSLPLLFPGNDPPTVAALYSNLCSLVLDYAARQKVGGINLTYGYLKQFPVLMPSRYATTSPWCDSALRDWLLPRVLELIYTAWDLEPFARDIGYEGPPFQWDPDRRFLLRAELDAAFFHLYGIPRDDADYILDTFPIVRKNDGKAYGEYRTKRVILEIYDALAEAIRTGRAYQTRLDPPPADPRVAHPADSRATPVTPAPRTAAQPEGPAARRRRRGRRA